MPPFFGAVGQCVAWLVWGEGRSEVKGEFMDPGGSMKEDMNAAPHPTPATPLGTTNYNRAANRVP